MFVKMVSQKLSLPILLCAALLFAQPVSAVDVDFEVFTTSGVPVDTLSVPGVQFTSGDGWITDQVNNSLYVELYGRVITGAFPDGSVVLTMQFDLPQANLSFGLGSSTVGEEITASVTGYLFGSQVSFQSFSTDPAACTGPPCADEVLVQIAGPVDRIVLARTAGIAYPVVDNLLGTDIQSAAVPMMTEWGMLIFVMLLCLAAGSCLK